MPVACRQHQARPLMQSRLPEPGASPSSSKQMTPNSHFSLWGCSTAGTVPVWKEECTAVTAMPRPIWKLLRDIRHFVRINSLLAAEGGTSGRPVSQGDVQEARKILLYQFSVANSCVNNFDAGFEIKRLNVLKRSALLGIQLGSTRGNVEQLMVMRTKRTLRNADFSSQQTRTLPSCYATGLAEPLDRSSPPSVTTVSDLRQGGGTSVRKADFPW
jgi:hypothetical protein